MVLEGPIGQLATTSEHTHCDCCRKTASQFSPIPEYDEGKFWRHAMVCPTCFAEITKLEQRQQMDAAEHNYRLQLEYR